MLGWLKLTYKHTLLEPIGQPMSGLLYIEILAVIVSLNIELLV